MKVEMHVQHGSTVMLLNIKWMINRKPKDEPLLGRPTLEIMGLNIEEILATTSDRFDGDIDMGMELFDPKKGVIYHAYCTKETTTAKKALKVRPKTSSKTG